MSLWLWSPQTGQRLAFATPASAGPQWQALPKDRPPKSTVRDDVSRWEWEDTIERIHHGLYVAVREQAGREASPTTAIIDSQTAKRDVPLARTSRQEPG